MKKTQQQKILQLLKKGTVNSYALTYEYRIKQAPTRISELKDQGYNIISSPLKPDRSVDYSLVLKGEKKPIYDWDFSTGNARQVIVGYETV